MTLERAHGYGCQCETCEAAMRKWATGGKPCVFNKKLLELVVFRRNEMTRQPKKRVVTIEHNVEGCGPTLPLDATTMEDVWTMFVEECAVGESITLLVGEMSQEDYDALPEWDGW